MNGASYSYKKVSGHLENAQRYTPLCFFLDQYSLSMTRSDWDRITQLVSSLHSWKHDRLCSLALEVSLIYEKIPFAVMQDSRYCPLDRCLDKVEISHCPRRKLATHERHYRHSTGRASFSA